MQIDRQREREGQRPLPMPDSQKGAALKQGIYLFRLSMARMFWREKQTFMQTDR